MKSIESKKLKRLTTIVFCIGMLYLALTLTGCSYSPAPAEKELPDTWEDSGFLTMGHCLTVQSGDGQLTLDDYIDALSANGLYYASWTMGDSEPYENSEGETVDLFDARLYFLLGEFHGEEEAQSNMDKWIDTGETNYEILSREEITCNGQSYHLITYNCVKETNPYERGVSAFGIYRNNAMCIELTCKDEFEEDLKTILVNFLNNCTYSEN